MMLLIAKPIKMKTQSLLDGELIEWVVYPIRSPSLLTKFTTIQFDWAIVFSRWGVRNISRF